MDDCVQEAFYALWKKRDSLYAHPNIRGWLYIAADNKLLNQKTVAKRRCKSCAYDVDEEQSVIQPPPYIKAWASKEQQDAFIRVQLDKIEALIGESSYKLLIQYYDRHITIEELADKLDTTPANVRMRVKRVLDNIRKQKLFSFLTLALLYYRLYRK